ncbi:glycosyltransferase family 4 protein [Cellulomonas sp. P5_C5]
MRPASPFDPVYLRLATARLGHDLFVTPGFNAVPGAGVRQILTLHDLIHVRYADESGKLKATYYERIVRPAVVRAGLVMTVSETSRADILDWTGLDPAQVVNVGNGCSMPVAVDDAASSNRSAARPTVLFVGNDRPHKRVDLLVAVGSLLPADVRMVVVGVSERALAEHCSAVGVSTSRFELRSGLTDRELRDVYDAADCLLFPSDFEGFGLPALEAMARRTAVVYCCTAVGEVVGDLGFRAEPDAAALAGAVTRAIGARDDLGSRLTARALTFDWDRVAARVGSAIESGLNR